MAEEHKCERSEDVEKLYGHAVDYCYEENGIFWVGNGEYETGVNYCPFCGMKAPKSVEDARAALAGEKKDD